MPHPSTAPQTARQVERIREILVGRQMQEVEQRLARLEKHLRPMPADEAAGTLDARLAAFQRHQEERLIRLRDEVDAGRLQQFEEIRRLAQQVQSLAREQHGQGGDGGDGGELEQRLGRWMQSWQDDLQRYLKEREDYLVGQLRAELDRLRAWTRSETERLSGSAGAAPTERYRQSFQRLAEFAQAMADELNEPRP